VDLSMDLVLVQGLCREKGRQQIAQPEPRHREQMDVAAGVAGEGDTRQDAHVRTAEPPIGQLARQVHRRINEG
jgi:hypothetical protein